MSEHPSLDRMNTAVDGGLSAADLADLRAHVDVCPVCREEYALLSETVSAVRALPTTAEPPAAAWAGIEARITGRTDLGDRAPAHEETAHGSASVEVVSLVDRTRERVEVRSRRLAPALTWPQLAAAAALVAVVSATTMWLALDGGRSSVGPQPELAGPALGGAAARAVSLEGTRYAETADRLQQILDEGRTLLDPETLLTIEESLNTVDAAIADVEEALRSDPNSALLSRLLTTHQRTRLGVLQRAADAVQAQT